ncbi:YceI family protein [Peristeroidobacter agariperforans]|uniref:YceI family protein n=1 Tax=Peristeroidobacter agariperforans TaxID=268404 RepID=UPI0018E4E027|nr:YceI family protein [Peristeroidobacter agariperforans]
MFWTALLGAPSTHAADARYELDPEHLTIGFLVSHIGYADVLGFFTKATGSYTFDEATRTLKDVRVAVESKSVFTGHDKRDGHLRGSDFLDASRAPLVVFTADSAEWRDDKTFVVNGELELLGKRRPLRLTGTLNKSGIYPIGGASKPYVMGASLRATVKRSDWDMNYAVANGWVGDDVELIIEFEARRTAP